MSTTESPLADSLAAARITNDTVSSPPKLHPHFQDPKADLTLISSDGTRFLIRRVYLEAGSEVFDGMFETLRSNAGGGEVDTESGLPLVRLEEKETDLGVFLTFLVRDVARPQSMKKEETVRLLRMADKYEAPMVRETAVRFLAPFRYLDAPFVFGAAVVYHQLDLARSALAKFKFTTEPLAHYYCDDEGVYHRINCPSTLGASQVFGISQIPDEYLDKFPVAVLVALLKMQDAVASKKDTWAELAPTLTI